MEKKPVNVKIQDISLKKAIFDLQKCEENKEYKIQFIDEISTYHLDNVTFIVEYTRKAVDSSPFKLEISYGATIKADLNGLTANEESVDEFAERKKQEIVRKLSFPSRTSVLISEITRESGSVLVTVPNIISSTQEKGETNNASKKN